MVTFSKITTQRSESRRCEWGCTSAQLALILFLLVLLCSTACTSSTEPDLPSLESPSIPRQTPADPGRGWSAYVQDVNPQVFDDPPYSVIVRLDMQRIPADPPVDVRPIADGNLDNVDYRLMDLEKGRDYGGPTNDCYQGFRSKLMSGTVPGGFRRGGMLCWKVERGSTAGLRLEIKIKKEAPVLFDATGSAELG